MKTRFIPALITLLAAAGVSIINIIKKTPLTRGLIYLLITIIAFYILGIIAKVIINRTLATKEEPIENTEETATAEEKVEDDAYADDSSTNDKIDKKVE